MAPPPRRSADFLEKNESQEGLEMRRRRAQVQRSASRDFPGWFVQILSTQCMCTVHVHVALWELQLCSLHV